MSNGKFPLPRLPHNEVRGCEDLGKMIAPAWKVVWVGKFQGINRLGSSHPTMPSWTAAGALLLLAGPDNNPWLWQPWQEISGFAGAPWQPENAPKAWNSNVLAAVRSFVAAFQAETNHLKRFNFMKKTNDNYSEGRNAFIDLVKSRWNSQWHISDIILQSMNDNACGPAQMLKRFKRRAVCVLERRFTELHKN